MKLLTDMLGCEYELDHVSRAIKYHVVSQQPAVVGAMHVTCSDESERECAESFQQWFCQELLPELKYWSKSPFRSANLGGRYEWGAVPIAEHHFATQESSRSFKLMVIKLNAHVSAVDTPRGARYGRMDRYDGESVFCGAMHALLDGGDLPFLNELQEAFQSEGRDRLQPLRDPQQVDPALRALLTAAVSVRLQARRAMLDIQDHQPRTPTLYYVLPCVTINRRQRDTELVCGIYTADHRDATRRDEYFGLSDDATRYQVTFRSRMLRITDKALAAPRQARDHRQLVHERWRRTVGQALRDNARCAAILRDASDKRRRQYAISMAQSLVWALAEVAPIPAVAMLFAHGVAGMHQVYRAHRLGQEAAGHDAANDMLVELKQRVEQLSPEKANALLDALVTEHGEGAGAVPFDERIV